MFNARDEFGDTPLFKAVQHCGRTKAIRCLLTVGNHTIGTHIRNNVGENIFHILAKGGNVNLLYFLIDILPVYSATTAPNTLATHRIKQAQTSLHVEEDPEPLSPTLLITSPAPPSAKVSFMDRFNKSRRNSTFVQHMNILADNPAQFVVVDPKIQQLLNEKDKSGFTRMFMPRYF
jgi:hypothetical protein